MELKHDEEIVIRNFSSQYASILSNIKVANSQLEVALKDKEQAEKLLIDISKSISEKTTILTALNSEESRINAELSQRERVVNESEERLTMASKDFESWKVEQTKELSEEKALLSIEINELKSSLNILKSRQESADKAYAETTEKLESLLNTANLCEREISKIREDIVSLNSEKDKKVRSVNRKIQAKEKELEEVSKKVQEEIIKVENPRKNLEAEKLAFQTEQQQFKIVVRRFRKEFNLLHPGLNLPF